jgi:WD40 repeat protein
VAAPGAGTSDNESPTAGAAPSAWASSRAGIRTREIRDSKETNFDAHFLGADTLVIVYQRKVTLHRLADEAAGTLVVVDRPNRGSIGTSAGSPDGEALCIGDTAGWLCLFDVAALRVEPLSPPRSEVQLATGVAGAAFSDDGARLLTMCMQAEAVEVRDARSAELLVLRTLAFNTPHTSLGSNLLHCAAGLVVAVGGGTLDIREDLDSKRARVWRLDTDGEEEVATLQLTAFASAAAMRVDGSQVAVGGADGVVRLFASDGWTLGAELAEPGDTSHVRSLAYAPDRQRLVVGRKSGTFVVYDVSSLATVGRFTEAGSDGLTAAYAPTGEVLALGGQFCQGVTLRELAPPPPLRRWTMDGAVDGAALAGAVTVGDIVVLAAGSHIEVQNRNGTAPTLTIKLSAAVGNLNNLKLSSPVAMQPGGRHVACAVAAGRVVMCYAVSSGEEVFSLDRADMGGSAAGLCWSPGGNLLLVWSAFGLVVFDAVGAKLRVLGDQASGVAFSTDGTRLATTRWLATTRTFSISVHNTATWDVTHTLPMGSDICCSPCFDPAGECLAAWVADGPPGGSVVVHRLDGSAKPQRFPGANAMGALAFSADGRFLFGAGALDVPSYLGHDRMVALSRATGGEADWSVAFAAMALPPGTPNGGTLAVPAMATPSDARPLLLQIAVGSEFIEVDIGFVRRAIEDNAWDYERLAQLAETVELDAFGWHITTAPHCLNIRDTATGDTLLHRCANTGNATLAAACFAPASATFVPIANHEGKTALHVALERREQSVVRTMAENLTPHLNDTTAALVTDALATAALTMPEVVLPVLNAIEPTVLVEQATMRTLYYRMEVIGLNAATLILIDDPDLAKDAHTFESERVIDADLGSAADRDLTPWSNTIPSADINATYTLISFKALMLSGLAGEPAGNASGGSSAFHAIVDNCDASVFDSKLLQYVIQYKFETNVLPMLRQTAALYTGATLVASAATLTSSIQLEGEWEGNKLPYIHIGQGVMVAVELVSLLYEARQLARQDTKSYFSSPWNLMDIAASVALIIGAVGHFSRSADTVHLFGALGVALKWFSATRGLPFFCVDGSMRVV